MAVVHVLLTDSISADLYNISDMALSVRSTLVDGFSRAFRRNGWVLIGVYLLVSLLQGGLVWIATTMALPLGTVSPPPASGGQVPSPGTQLPPLISAQAVLLTTFTSGFLTVPVSVVAIRTLVSQFTGSIPEEFVFHRLGWATINSFLGTWMVSIAVGLLTIVLFVLASVGLFAAADQAMVGYLIGTWPGRALLVGACFVLLLPGAFLGVSLIFVGQEVAVRDKNVIGAIGGSWRLARDNRLRLFVLALLPFVIQMIFSVVIFEFLTPVLAQIAIVVATAIFQVVVLAIMARAYVQSYGDGINQATLYQKVK